VIDFTNILAARNQLTREKVMTDEMNMERTYLKETGCVHADLSMNTFTIRMFPDGAGMVSNWLSSNKPDEIAIQLGYVKAYNFVSTSQNSAAEVTINKGENGKGRMIRTTVYKALEDETCIEVSFELENVKNDDFLKFSSTTNFKKIELLQYNPRKFQNVLVFREDSVSSDFELTLHQV